MPKRVLQGVVTSNACDKTITVKVQRRLRHPLYKKFITKSKKYAAQDPLNEYGVGQEVCIRECAPFSKTKCWEVFKQSS